MRKTLNGINRLTLCVVAAMFDKSPTEAGDKRLVLELGEKCYRLETSWLD